MPDSTPVYEDDDRMLHRLMQSVAPRFYVADDSVKTSVPSGITIDSNSAMLVNCTDQTEQRT